MKVYKMSVIIVLLFFTSIGCSQTSNKTQQDLPKEVSTTIKKDNKFWISSIERMRSDFNFDDFRLIEKRSFNLSYQSESFFTPEWTKIYEDYIFPSPKKDMFVDIYSSTLSFTEENGKKVALFEPDTRVYLIDVKREKLELITYSGTSDIYNSCTWIDNNRFLLIGFKEIIKNEEIVFSPFIWFFDITSKESYYYLYKGTFDKYIEDYFSAKYGVSVL